MPTAGRLSSRRRVVLLGRRDDADVRLASESVSPVHALIVRSAGRPVVRDLASRTGTYLNGKRIVEAEIGNGSELRLGSVRLRLSVPASRAPVEDPPPGSILTPVREVESADLPLARRTFLIGRRPECDLTLPDPDVGFVHAVVFAIDGVHAIRDLGTTAGTFVNGVRVGQRRLKPGDEITIGLRRFMYQQASAPPPKQPEPQSSDGSSALPAQGDSTEVTEALAGTSAIDPVLRAQPSVVAPDANSQAVPSAPPPIELRLKPRIGRRVSPLRVVRPPPEPPPESMPGPASKDAVAIAARISAWQRTAKRRLLRRLLFTFCLAGAAAAAAWHSVSPSLVVEAELPFRMANDDLTPAQQQQIQADWSTRLSDDRTREAAAAALKVHGHSPVGLLHRSGKDFRTRASLRWESRPSPQPPRLVLRYIGQSEGDADHVDALVDAAAASPSATDRASEVAQLRAEIARTDHAQLLQEKAYLERRVNEMKEAVRLLDLATPTAARLSALQKAASRAHSAHRAAVEARVRGEMQQFDAVQRKKNPPPAARKEPATRPVRDLLDAESTSAERLRDAERTLQVAQAQVNETSARRKELKSLEVRLAAVNASVERDDKAAEKGESADREPVGARRPARSRVIERRDPRPLAAAAALAVVLAASVPLLLRSLPRTALPVT